MDGVQEESVAADVHAFGLSWRSEANATSVKYKDCGERGHEEEKED